jgi:hypothetical protein
MKSYNLKPILNLFKDKPAHEPLANKIQEFFKEEFDPEWQDNYYSVLIHNLPTIESHLANDGYIIDETTGLWSFDNEAIGNKHTFSMANFVDKNYHLFKDKKVVTILGDYGTVNLQLKFCGIDIATSIINPECVVGAVLTCIGHDCPPIKINTDCQELDVLFIASVFDDDEKAYRNWDFMIDMNLSGKKVYFTSDNMTHLSKHMIPGKFKPIDFEPKKDYTDLRLGYGNRIFEII